MLFPVSSPQRTGEAEDFAERFLFYLIRNEDLNNIGASILDAAITVHRELGPGLLASAYELALMQELTLRKPNVQRQVAVPLKFKGIDLGKAYEIDLLVEKKIVVEIKSVLDMHPVYTAQLITYLKSSNKQPGYLINFNVALLKDGFKRIVYNF